jgi:putative endonuclease
MRVYILQSLKSGKFYCGQTEDLDDRLQRHNSGRNKSTSNGAPWTLKWQIQVQTRSEAVKLERKIKSRGAKRFLEDLKL